MISLWSVDNAALVLARAVLRREPKVEMKIFLGGSRPADSFSAIDTWNMAIETATQKYVRLGIAVDRASDEENSFLQSYCKNIFSIDYELLSSFANRGLSDTVEFRRLARKYLRLARNAHCDGVFFLSGILADEACCKILAKTLGARINPIYVTDFLPESFFISGEKQKIEIYADQDEDRVHREAEKFLHMKLAKGTVKRIA